MRNFLEKETKHPIHTAKPTSRQTDGVRQNSGVWFYTTTFANNSFSPGENSSARGQPNIDRQTDHNSPRKGEGAARSLDRNNVRGLRTALGTLRNFWKTLTLRVCFKRSSRCDDLPPCAHRAAEFNLARSPFERRTSGRGPHEDLGSDEVLGKLFTIARSSRESILSHLVEKFAKLRSNGARLRSFGEFVAVALPSD